MIHILLLILKIIGIILLVILCLALLILFFPITYVGNVDIKDNLVYCKFRAGWLFHIVHFGMKSKQRDVSYALRVFGIPVVLSKKETEIKQESETKKKTEQGQKAKSHNNKKTGIKIENKRRTQKTTYETQSDNQKKSVTEKIKEFFENAKAKILRISKNIKNYSNKAKEIKRFITANTTKEAYNYGKKILTRLIRHIFPKKLKGNVQFGFEEPHMTGQALGYIAMGFSMLNINPKDINVEPDFEKEIFAGKFKFKGRIVLGVAGFYILKLYFKKEINNIIKKFK